MAREPFEINGVTVAPGQQVSLDIPAARLYTHSEMTIPVHIVHGRKPGRRLFVSAAIHGDEINGVEIIRRVLKSPLLKRLHGTLVAVPIVNVYGFIQHSRYLPDRRDLNRNFPGSQRGSLTARLAHVFLEEIVSRCTHGIDLHTAAVHRSNLPQVRADLDDPETRAIAEVFGVPVLLNAAVRDGSLRQVAAERGVPVLVYEAGEALRFDETAIRAGVKGVIEVMRKLEMVRPTKYRRRKPSRTVVARSGSWVRAPESGILRAVQPLGAVVAKGETLGVIADPLGDEEIVVEASSDGIIIGRVNLPLVNEGDALFHIARYAKPERIAARVEAFQTEHQEQAPEFFEEPPIV